jgi:hypothetical protein
MYDSRPAVRRHGQPGANVLTVEVGFSTLVGSLMGAGSSNLDSAEKVLNVEEEVADAISHGHWVIVVHSHTEGASGSGTLPGLTTSRRFPLSSKMTKAAASGTMPYR